MDADRSRRVPALPLLAGNLLAVALLGLVLLGAVFSGQAAHWRPLWLMQAILFAVGAAVVLVLLPVERWGLARLRRHTRSAFIEAVLVAAVASLLGIPGGLGVATVSALQSEGITSSDPGGFFGYFITAGFALTIACFVIALAGRLLAELLRRLPRAVSNTVIALAVLNVGLAIWGSLATP